ncbi:hypothetical protein CLV59_103658 [Chitinophaga dinghuensis]|uniref:Uncharacterized protein n=1 Tax=Chitinophaga dinghuensis TaxID=1539050 RepID=A0A327W5N2_9BACT|nr:hypothetical protein [Chitinophaga dinghuensis]RAJ83686.1 hypothetical protein CLV59_103658 [Chitinophaga dinghuensis]
MQKDDASTLLKYDISTDPATVNISGDNNPDTAKIIIQVKADTNVLCKYISIQVPVGPDATDMYSVNPLPNSSSDNSDWVPTNDFVPGMGNDNSGNDSTFLYKHTNDGYTVDSDVTFTINGTVNDEAGTAQIMIREISATVDDGTYQIRPMTHNITKVATQDTFYLNSAVVAYLDTPGVPVALLDRNRGFQLNWQSNGSDFKLFIGGTGGQPIDLGTQSFYQVSAGLTSDTTYIIQAQKDSDYLNLEYTVSINAPDAGFTSLSANTFTDLSQGSTKILGSQHILAQGGQVDTAYWHATSDGFVIASIYPIFSSDLGITNEITLATIITGTNSFTISCIADNLGQAYNSLSIPVKQGDVFSYLCGTSSGEPGMTTTFIWVGLGTGMPTTTVGSESDKQLVQKAKNDMNAYFSKRKQKAEDFITAFETAFEKTLQPAAKEQLIKKLL